MVPTETMWFDFWLKSKWQYLILSYLMRIRCDATRPSNESTTFVILLRHYLHYNVNQHFQGRALQEAEGSFLRPATVKALCHTFFARGFAVLIKHSSSFNPHTRFLEHSAEWTVGLHRPLGILSRASTTLTPWLAASAGNRTRYLSIILLSQDSRSPD